MKLACFSETQARADAQPAQPELVDQEPGADLAGDRVDEHRAGVLAARLVLTTPPHDLGDRRLGRRPVTGMQAEAHVQDDVVRSSRSEPRKRRPSRSTGQVSGAGSAAREVDEGRRRRRTPPCRSRARRRSSAPRRRPSRGRRRPTRSRSDRRRRCGGRASAGRQRHRPRTTSPVEDLDVGGQLGHADGDAGKAGVGDEQVRAAADDQHRQPRSGPGRADQWPARRPCAAGPAAPPGHRPGRSSAGRAAGRASATGPRISAAASTRRQPVDRHHGHPPRRPAGQHLFGQRGDVAAAHRDAHVTRAGLAGEERDEVLPAGQPHDRGCRGGRRARRRRSACW